MKKIIIVLLLLVSLTSCEVSKLDITNCLDGSTNKFKVNEKVLLKDGYFNDGATKWHITSIDCSSGYPIYSFVSDDNKKATETWEINFIKYTEWNN